MRNTFNVGANWKQIAASAALTAGVMGLGGCSNDASIASQNLSTAADNFEIDRRIVFINGVTDKYLFEIEGRCSIEVDEPKKKLDVTCKTADGKYKKHFLGLSDNTTYIVEQVDGAAVSKDHYRVTFKPEAIVPDIRMQ